MATWTRHPQERDGEYFFSGKFVVTKHVLLELTQQEIMSIYHEIQRLVEENNGLDYLQVYTDEKERKLFFIDQLNQEMLESGDHPKEHHYCTLLFAYEY